MDPMTAYLLSMQAAGLIVSFFGARHQYKMIELGRKLEQEQFSTNMAAIKLESAEGSLEEMKQVRQNIGSQIAINAARGNRGGSSYWGISEARSNLDKDERLRSLNLMSQEAQLRAGHISSLFKANQASYDLGMGLLNKVINNTPISSGTDSLFNENKTAKSGVNPDTGFKWGSTEDAMGYS